MARLDFKLPDIGEGVTEGEIVQWFVGAGDTVGEDDPMVEVMTDKATVTIVLRGWGDCAGWGGNFDVGVACGFERRGGATIFEATCDCRGGDSGSVAGGRVVWGRGSDLCE
jgi:hypothetical protein